MKRNICLIIVLVILLSLLSACSGANKNAQIRPLEQSGVWNLSERYPLTYSSLHYIAIYSVNGESFCLKANRNAKEPGMSKRVIDSRDIGGPILALCESKQHDSDGNPSYTYYECYTGSYRYFIGRESDGFRIEDFLTIDDAVVLMTSPESPKGKVKLTETEWNAQYRTEFCNLEIVIRPNDGGALCKSLPASYQKNTENGETYYVSSAGDDIVYTDGVNSVQIRQANRAGSDAVSYHTVSECKAILSLLESE